MPIIVTNCTARKRGGKHTLAFRPEMVGATLFDTIGNWRSAASERSAERPAADLYSGRSISEARRSAGSAQAALFFVSAGMGLIPAERRIPAYDLTPVQADGGLASALLRHGASAQAWWSLLWDNGLSHLIRDRSEQLILIALPATYLRMLALDLAEVLPAEVSRLRIFTSPAGGEEVPKALRTAVMPYDERLESVKSFAGTRADFPQRALRHFIEELQGVDESLEDSRSLVESSLKSYDLRETPERKRLDDAQIKTLIISRWDSCLGRSTRLLRVLRDEELVACEQKRFAQLWREVRNEISCASPAGAIG